MVCGQALDLMLFKWDNAYRMLEIAEANYVADGKAKRPKHRLGCCGCSGSPFAMHAIVSKINFAFCKYY